MSGENKKPDVGDANDKNPKWEHREFKIHGKMQEVVNLSIKATEAEIAALKRKLEKLQYGS